MAYQGQVLKNPVTGEEFTFLTTAQTTDGKILVFRCKVAPGGAKLPVHRHSSQQERFTVLSGTLGVRLGKEKLELRAGESITLPRMVKHQWWNAGNENVEFQVEVEPAGNLEMGLEALAGLAADGKLNKKAMPKNPFQLVNIGRLTETYLPGVPLWMQRSMLAVGSTCGRVLGYDPYFSEYTGYAAANSEQTEVGAA